MLLDNGWFRTVTLPEVELETTSIKCIEPRGIVTVDGTLHEVDVIVYATGFDALCFLSSIDVHGRGGVSLRDLWGDSDARAYLGLTVPGFPNFFCLYGPNLQPGHGGSLIFSIECQIDLIVELLVRAADAGGLGAVECTEEAFDRYNAKVDARHQHMIWSHPRLRTYYRNSRGRVVVNTPFRVVDYWQMTRSPEVGAYAFELPRDASHAAEDSDASTLVQGEVG
jgi:4-hydroxyacetophenone monooxygenase